MQSWRASEHPPAPAKRQRAGERTAGQNQRTCNNREALDGLRRRERWIHCCAGYVRRHAVKVEEEPCDSVTQHEGRQDGEGYYGAATLQVMESCRHPAGHRRRNPKADKDDETGESIRYQNRPRGFGLTLAFRCGTRSAFTLKESNYWRTCYRVVDCTTLFADAPALRSASTLRQPVSEQTSRCGSAGIANKK